MAYHYPLYEYPWPPLDNRELLPQRLADELQQLGVEAEQLSGLNVWAIAAKALQAAAKEQAEKRR